MLKHLPLSGYSKEVSALLIFLTLALLRQAEGRGGKGYASCTPYQWDDLENAFEGAEWYCTGIICDSKPPEGCGAPIFLKEKSKHAFEGN